MPRNSLLILNLRNMKILIISFSIDNIKKLKTNKR